MQHLANRYFNRGLFLLHVKNDHKNPMEVEQLGMRDIQIASDMDHEVVSYGEEIGWGSDDRAEKRFNVNLVRIRGYIILRDLGYNNDWGVEDLIDDTVNIIRTEYTKDDSEFFAAMSVAARQQELEIQIMRYKSIHGDLETAAKIAVRMIIEDEVVFTDAMRQAVEVLIKYVESDQAKDDFRSKMTPVLRSYRKTVMELVNEKRQAARDDLDSISASINKSLSSSRRGGGSHICSSDSNLPGGDESSRFLTMEDF
jgi:hypothetical protein